MYQKMQNFTGYQNIYNSLGEKYDNRVRGDKFSKYQQNSIENEQYFVVSTVKVLFSNKTNIIFGISSKN